MTRRLVALALIALPGAAGAQALQCTLPAHIERPRPELPSADQPQRLLPIGGYTLAVTWSPQQCFEQGRKPDSRFACGGGNRFGFTLHGLWPDGVGKEWPQYCRAAALLPEPVIRAHLCATPSAQLLQHEWAKHGTCMTGETPASYFARSTGLYAGLHFPNMDRLSRGSTTAGAVAQAIAAANPGIGADMMRVTANRRGWLDEVWFCLDRRFAYVRCRAGSGGLPPGATIKVWRGSRRPG